VEAVMRRSLGLLAVVGILFAAMRAFAARPTIAYLDFTGLPWLRA
jgi:hypothetical protein